MIIIDKMYIMVKQKDVIFYKDWKNIDINIKNIWVLKKNVFLIQRIYYLINMVLIILK